MQSTLFEKETFGSDVTVTWVSPHFGYPQTLVIWASPSQITLAIWVRVRVTGDAHITRVRGMGCPKCGDASITVTPVLSVRIACVAGAKRGGSGGGGRGKTTLPIPLPLSTPASQSGLHIRQWKLDMTKGPGTGKKFVRNNEVSFYRSSLSYIFILLLGQRKLFLIPRTWLYRGSLRYRGSTVWKRLVGTSSRIQIYRI